MAIMTLKDMDFSSYAAKHALLITTSGTYTLDNVIFDQSGTNDIETTHAAGVAVIDIINGGTVPTVTVTGAGTISITNTIILSLTGIQTDSEVRIINLDDTTNFNKELAGSEQISGSVTKVVIADGGTGYAVNDVLTVVGGTGTAATITVDAVSTGVVTAISITTGGTYTVNPSNPVTTTVAPAGGTGCTLRLTIGGTFSYAYDSSFNPNVAIIIFHLNFRETRLEQALSAVSQSIPIQQTIDRVYNNPA